MDNKIRGCIFGGAIGDALGYPIEFYSQNRLIDEFESVERFEMQLDNRGKAIFSDDTQMTIFTAAAIGDLGSGDFVHIMHKYYMMWLGTQHSTEKMYGSWVTTVDDLYVCRAPGNSCLTALESGKLGTTENKVNNSKGCGGVMRVAPIGCYAKNPESAFDYGIKAAALTHGHILGHVTAGAFAMLISRILNNEEKLIESVKVVCQHILSEYGSDQDTTYLIRLIIKAAQLANRKDISDIDAINQLGEGWVAEEALAISVYCALRHQDNYEDAIKAAVFHRGDSDSTGSITGNIMGVLLGYDKIPKKYLDVIEQRTTLNKGVNVILNARENA